MASNTLPGCWRALVVDDADPERRGRVRVRIPQLHPPQVPDAACPWAEIMTFGGPGAFGDLVNYRPGDPVFVDFEGGNPTMPVVVGGWFTSAAYPQDLRDDYPGARQRWRRQSRSGAFVEFDERPGSLRIHLKAGDAEVELNQTSKVVTVRTTNEVLVQAPAVRVESTSATVQTTTAQVNASGDAGVTAGGTLTARGAVVSVVSGGALSFQAAGPVTFACPSFYVTTTDIGFSTDPHVP